MTNDHRTTTKTENEFRHTPPVGPTKSTTNTNRFNYIINYANKVNAEKIVDEMYVGRGEL